MLVEERLDVESYDRWSDSGASVTSDWNGRSLLMLEGDLKAGKDLSGHFHKARFIQDGDTMFICEKSEDKTQTTTKTSADLTLKADSGQKPVAEGSVKYSRETKDQNGNSDKVTLQGKGSIDSQGKTSTEATVRYEKTF